VLALTDGAVWTVALLDAHGHANGHEEGGGDGFDSSGGAQLTASVAVANLAAREGQNLCAFELEVCCEGGRGGGL
jgi:hypothetical protein